MLNQPARLHDTQIVKPPITGPVESGQGLQAFERQVRKSNGSFQFLDVDELYATAGPGSWLIDKYLDTNAMSMVFAEAGSFKSFVAIDIGLCIAAGFSWHGHGVQQGLVVYIAGEGQAGMNRRVKAWEQSHRTSLKGVPFHVSNRPVQFLTPESVMEMCTALDELRDRWGNPALVIIDTLNRNFGPGDENSTADMTKFISIIDEHLRFRYGCAILIVHHSGLNATERARGASALRAALDWEYRITKDSENRLTLINTKTKDHEPPPPLSFVPGIIELDEWADPDTGKPAVSCVLHLTETKPQNKGRRLAGAKKIALDALSAAIEESGEDASMQTGETAPRSVHIDTWRAAAYSAGISTTATMDAKKKAFQRAVTDLRNDGWVETKDDYWWPTRDTGQGRDNSGTCPGTF